MLPITSQLARQFWDDPTDFMRRELSRVLGEPRGTNDWVAKYPVDIRETDNAFHVDAEVPGFTKEEIDVSLENGLLTISAERKAEKKEAEGEPHLKERRYTKIARSFTLPTRIDESKIEATLEHGVLHLMLPKVEEVKPRRIIVK